MRRALGGLAFFGSPLGIVFSTVLIDLIGFGIVIPLVPLYAEQFGASVIEIGLLTGVYALMQLIFAPIWGRVSDRFGRRPVILGSLLGSSVAWLMFGFAGALWVLFLARILDGISGASYAAAQAYVADITTTEDRVRGMGLIGAAFGLGFIIGPGIGAVFATISPSAPFMVAATAALLNFVVAYRRLPESLVPGAHAAARRSRWTALIRAVGSRDVGPLVWISFIGSLGFIGMESVFTLFGNRQFGFGLTETGLVFVFIGVFAAIVQGGLVHRLTKRFGEWPVLRTGLWLTAAALILLGLSTQLWQLFPALALLALASGLVFPTISGLVSQRTAAADQGGILGILASAGGLARLVAPIGATVVFQTIGAPAPLIIGGVLFAVCGVLAASPLVRPVVGN
ncbi:MAG: MFS transporter [Thermoleophilia bacterium]|nr:MFS transporter [Thermoleophilia bacterium]